MSWTWCIGMFLPVLLVRDVGPWAWAVFAIPNVIGAAAMGRVLRDAEASRRFTEAHTEACTAFSAVTILFQVTFVGWIGRLLVGNWAAALMICTVVVTLAISQRGRRAEWAMAAAILLFSIAAFAVAISTGREMILAGFPTRWDDDSTGLPYVAMVCMLGFALCPYLDLTFHKARQATSPAAGLAAFIFGFGGPFLLMLVFTLWYARLLAPLSRGHLPAIPNALRWALAAHLCVQCGYTIAVHWRELGWGPQLSESIAKNPRKVAAAVVGFVAAIAVHGVGLMSVRLGVTQLLPAEVVYRLFLSFYGLVFPAYVWICVVPSREAAEMTRARYRVLIAVLIIAAPMYWKGFIQNQWSWLAPGVGVVLLAPLTLPWLARPRNASLTKASSGRGRRRR